MASWIQPLIDNVVYELVSLFVAAILGVAVPWLRQLVNSHLSQSAQSLINEIADEAYAFAEQVYGDLNGSEKLSHAMNYAIGKLNRLGLSITPEELRAAIERAWLAHNRTSEVS
ncbi:MAG: hypothetical protein IMW91_00570 [Firmicutes bacterium]|nr:hypothetical protein [Bacillota bacterium]